MGSRWMEKRLKHFPKLHIIKNPLLAGFLILLNLVFISLDLSFKCLTQFLAQAKVMAKIIDERAPSGRVDVLPFFNQ